MVAFLVVVTLIEGTHLAYWARVLIAGAVGGFVFCVGYLITSTIQQRRKTH
jgi:hypothetical protein